MKSVSGKNASVVLCHRCRNETLPRLKLPSWQRDVLRKAADGMVTTTDPKAERIKRRKEARQIRTALATRDMGAIKLLLRGIAKADEPASEECEYCLRLIATPAAA